MIRTIPTIPKRKKAITKRFLKSSTYSCWIRNFEKNINKRKLNHILIMKSLLGWLELEKKGGAAYTPRSLKVM